VIVGERDAHESPECILMKSGFTVSEHCSSRPSCFDFAARKNRTLVFVKSQPEISSLSPHDLRELRSISENFSAASLLICDRTREKPLEDDTVYTRHGVVVVTSKTFENVLVQGLSPLIQASPGGYYVQIDSRALRRRRQEFDLSVADVADMAGVSRRTIYGYERGMAKASVPVAYNIIRALGIPVAKQVNILDRSREQQRSCLFTAARRMFSRNKLLQKIMNKFARSHITTVKRAPFDFVILVPDSRRILGGIATAKEPELSRRIDEILSVSRVVDAYPVLITEGERPWKRDILCVSGEEVSRMNGPEDLIAKIT
jgi:predicted transcriptional regulator